MSKFVYPFYFILFYDTMVMIIEGRMREKLSDLLKKYVTIFINEYAEFLNKQQLQLLKAIDYDKIIKISDFSIPVGIINYDQIYISDNLINIPRNNSLSVSLNNKNYTGYLKYINAMGCDTYQYYADQLMFLVFKLVIGNDNGIINGFINHEVNKLKQKYHFQAVNLYKREEVISNKVMNILGYDNCLRIMFMDMPSSFKYLNDHLGYRYADFYYQISLMVNYQYKKLRIDKYTSKDGLIKYATDYDNLLYGDAYNYLLDFSINNNRI